MIAFLGPIEWLPFGCPLNVAFGIGTMTRFNQIFHKPKTTEMIEDERI